ncbi:MAG TPA: hypothetical protein VHE30_20730 [Polyangiaceae bacterium]|nr:hypothetical protein [Polyangiaceae bacterium]
MRTAALALVVAPFLVACPNTSPDRVRLVASVDSVSLAVASGTLVNTLSGTFEVVIDVGDLASSDATITDPPSFELVAASDQGSIRKLDATPSGQAFPITVKSGQHVVISFTLTDQNTLDAATLGKACAGPVQITASLQDSLTADRPTAFESAAVSVTGCP